MRSADGVRRQRAAIVLGVAMALSSVPIIMQTLVVRQGDGRTVMTVLLVALGVLSGGAAFLASRGFPSIAGLWLTLIPCGGALGSVLLSHELGSAPFLGALGVAVAMVTLEGRALWWGLGLSVLSTLAMAALGATGELAPTPMRLVLVTSVVLVALVALAVAISTRSFDNLLREVALQQEHAADVEARYRLIAENTTDLVALIDREDRVSWASPSFERVLGVDPRGRQAHEGFVDDAERGAFDTLLVLARAGQPGRGEVSRLRRDGSRGRFECVVSPIAGEALLLCVARDVTAERAMTAELEQARKMEALGRFAGSIAHDFNNLLSVMRTCTALAARAVPVDSSARADLNDVQEAVSRAGGLTAQLLAFSRRDVVLPTRVELGPLLTRTAALAQRLVGLDMKVETDVPADVWAISCGPSQLDQVVMNLAANARDAMPGGGTLRLAAKNVTRAGLGDAVRVTVTDTGSGMTADARAHLFEPFYTTKPVGIGTGLGLATVFGVVKSLGGELEVESELGKGTEFRLWFPRAPAPEAAPAPRAPARPISRASDVTVLVVDDDADVRSLMVRLITHEGFQVVTAGNAEQALTLALTMADLPLLVTDVLLPGRDGVWLAQRMLERFPSMQVIVVSGFAPDPQATSRLIAQGAQFIPKPFSPAALVEAIRTALSLPPSPPEGEKVGERGEPPLS